MIIVSLCLRSFLRRSGAALLLLTACVSFAMPATAQSPSPDGAPVVFDHDTLFTLYAPIAAFTPAERARLAAERLERLAEDSAFNPRSLTIVDSDMDAVIYAGDTALMTVTDGDAAPTGETRQALASDYVRRLQRAIKRYRAERAAGHIARACFLAACAVLTLLCLLTLAARLLAWIDARLLAWKGTRIRALKVQQSELLSVDRVADALMALAHTLRFVAVLTLLYLFLVFVLGLFPWTAPYAAALGASLLQPIRAAGRGLLTTLPGLFTILIILIVTRYAIAVLRFLFTEIERGAITIRGFDREWADPTYKLVRLLALLLALIAAFPYVPGSRAPAFEAISVMAGLLLSLGSTGAVSNAVAGVVLTYMRPFRIGDRVKIADTVGDVLEKSLLVTRICTSKNVEVAVPNALILGAHIVNYSAAASEKGLILHTSVTIGYDAPWRTIHALLIEAARATPGLLDTPTPYVLQTGLNDFYVSYQINAFTDQPNRQEAIYSALHAGIQDRFNAAGVEIMSPHYTSLRDGNQTTIPEDCLPQGYETSAFRHTVRTGAAPHQGAGDVAPEV